MNGWLDLYSAIWEKAVADDINFVVKRLHKCGFDSAYELFVSKKKEETIEKSDERFKKFKKELLDYCEIRTREIERRIRELVYKEAQDWPNNGNYKIRDKEYNLKLQELRLEVIEYAKEKMKKCWYKI